MRAFDFLSKGNLKKVQYRIDLPVKAKSFAFSIFTVLLKPLEEKWKKRTLSKENTATNKYKS